MHHKLYEDVVDVKFNAAIELTRYMSFMYPLNGDHLLDGSFSLRVSSRMDPVVLWVPYGCTLQSQRYASMWIKVLSRYQVVEAIPMAISSTE